MAQKDETPTRRYEPPMLLRVHVDPIQEMLTACPRSPGKTQAGFPGAPCASVGS